MTSIRLINWRGPVLINGEQHSVTGYVYSYRLLSKKAQNRIHLYKLSESYHSFKVSVITHYEIYIGCPLEQIGFWDSFFLDLVILPVDVETIKIAVMINNDLKKHSNQIDIPDLFIAATAIANNLPCASLNKKHFGRIKELKLIAA